MKVKMETKMKMNGEVLKSKMMFGRESGVRIIRGNMAGKSLLFSSFLFFSPL